MKGQHIALSGYFFNLGLLVAWYGWLAPPELLPRAIVLLVLVSPMLVPLRGMLHLRPYTYAWGSFLALFYFAHGTVEAYSNPIARWYALLEILFTSMWFLGSILFVRQARANTNKNNPPLP